MPEVRLTGAATLKPGEMKVVKAGETEILLIQLADTLVAVQPKCHTPAHRSNRAPSATIASSAPGIWAPSPCPPAICSNRRRSKASTHTRFALKAKIFSSTPIRRRTIFQKKRKSRTRAPSS